MKRKWTVLLVVLCSLLLLSPAFAQTYAPAVNYGTQLQSVGITYGDFNEDGKVDVLVTNAGASTLSLFLGNGHGALGNAISIAVGPNPISVVAADFNADGHLDVAVSLGNSQRFQVLFGVGNSTFLAPISILIPGAAHFTIGQLMVADFNLDGKPDLAVATDVGVAIFVNDGNGAFNETGIVNQNANIATFDINDVNGDRKPDIVGIESALDSNGDTAGKVFWASGNGDGTFQSVTQITQFTGTPAGIAVGDLNNDGLADIVISNSGGVIGGDGGGGGIGCTPRICPPVDGTPTPPLNIPGEIQIFVQQSNAAFTLAGTLTSDKNPGTVILADLNGDQHLDVVEASSAAPALRIFSNQGNIAFSPQTVLTLPFIAANIISVSLTNASALDLAATLPSGNEISVFANQGANTLSLTSSVNPSNVGQMVTLTATVHPSFPNAISGSVIFADGPNTLGSSPVDASGVSTLATSFDVAGIHSLLAVYGGNSSLVGGSSARLSQQVKAGTASVTLTSSGNPTVFGQGVSFTITVTPSGSGPMPTGSVNLLDGASILSAGSLDGSGKLVLSTSSLSLGAHTLTAQYSGDSTYGPAASPAIIQTVNKSNAAVNLSSAINPSVFGQSVSFSVSVSASGGSGVPTGTVSLNDTGTVLASSTLDAAGSAAFSGIALSAGSHFLTAHYSGDQNFSSGLSAVITQVVNKAQSSTTLSSNPNPSAFGAAVQLTAIVAAITPGGGTPTGVVIFMDGPAQIGSGALVNGKAVLSVSSLAAGSHNITASYGGDSNFNASAVAGANSVTQNIDKSSSSITLSAAPNPSSFSQAVILTARVSGAAGGPPTGIVSFSDGSSPLGSSSLSGGLAVISVTSLAVGSHNLVASYPGDSNVSASSSNIYMQIVNKESTALLLTSSMNPTTNASTIVLNVSATAPGGTPSGSITLFDGPQSVITSQLDVSGRAIFSLSSLAVGTHNFTVEYNGNSGFADAITVLKEVVLDSHSLVTLNTSTNPQTVGSPVTFTARVALALGGTATTGTVNFNDGRQVLASVPVKNSIASFTTKGLSAGQHQIVASYQVGRQAGPFDGVSAALLQTINAAPISKQDFTLRVRDSAATIRPGQSVMTVVTLTPLNGIAGPVRTVCLGVPLGASCNITPDVATFRGKLPLTARLTITTTGHEFGSSGDENNRHWPPKRSPERALHAALATLPLFGLCLLPAVKRRGRGFAAVAIMALSLTGCGSDLGAIARPNTPHGVYTITVQAQSGQITHSQTIRLTVR
jgi:Bacterial Ig-like domain (group 3)/FG-GAP-like repeat